MCSYLLLPLYKRIDTFLERHTDFNSLQPFRRSIAKFYLKHNRNLTKSLDVGQVLEGIFEFELSLRYFTQREECLKRDYQSIKASESCEKDQEQLTICLDQLNACAKCYWRDRRQLDALEYLLPFGPLYETWRSNPKWYLYPHLVADCADKGGCCSRQCGCCQRCESGPGRRRGMGHCTIDCICCSEARGFDLKDSDRKKIINSSFRVLEDMVSGMIEGGSNRTYYSHFMRAYFFGVESKMEKSLRWT